MSKKLTDWFPVNVKPILPGVYETPALASKRFQFWNGEFWCFYAPSVDAAYKYRKGKSMVQPHKWRGLAEKP